MSNDISKMDFKQLRNEVQLLRDELAIMKRKYEDIIYNLDTDNFSSRFVKEQGDMRTAVEITAEGIKTKVSKEDLDNSLSNYSTIEQTAEKISTAVTSVNNSTDEKLKNYSTTEQTAEKISTAVTSVNNSTDKKLKNYSTIEQTAEKIKQIVTKEFVAEQLEGEVVTNTTLQSAISQSATDIKLSVSQTYETKGDADSAYDDLNNSISTLNNSIANVSIAANRIASRVGDIEDGVFNDYTLFTQDKDKFTFEGNVEVKSTDTSSNTLKLSDGHIQLIPYSYENSVVDLGMYKIGTAWQPRMKFGQGDGNGNRIGWIYKTTDGFGLTYNNGKFNQPTIEFKDDGIYICGNVIFDGGTVSGL